MKEEVSGTMQVDSQVRKWVNMGVCVYIYIEICTLNICIHFKLTGILGGWSDTEYIVKAGLATRRPRPILNH